MRVTIERGISENKSDSNTEHGLSIHFVVKETRVSFLFAAVRDAFTHADLFSPSTVGTVRQSEANAS